MICKILTWRQGRLWILITFSNLGHSVLTDTMRVSCSPLGAFSTSVAYNSLLFFLSIEPELQAQNAREHIYIYINAFGCESPVLRIPSESTYIDQISPSANGCTNGVISNLANWICHCSNWLFWACCFLNKSTGPLCPWCTGNRELWSHRNLV